MTLLVILAFVLQSLLGILAMGIAYRLGIVAGGFLAMFETAA